MAEEKNTPAAPLAAADEKATKAPKQYQYVGPRPAPLVANLPLDLGQPRLGHIQQKYPADQLFAALGAAYVEYVMRTNTMAKDWWK